MPKKETVQSPTDKDMGVVYFVSNPTIPGYVKIGMTKNLQNRMDQLNDTNVPQPFVCLYACKAENYKQVEKTVHKILAQYREKGKEFFKAPQEVITAVQELLELLGTTDVTDTVQRQLDLDFGVDPTRIEVTSKHQIPERYKTYKNLKHLIEADKDFKPGLFAYRVAVHHRVKNVHYYRLNESTTYYDPEVFKDEAKIEGILKETV
jgi:hypothetical protein